MIIAQTTMSGKKLFGGKGSLVDIAGHYAKIGYTGVDLSFHESADKSDKNNPLVRADWRMWAAISKEELEERNILPVQAHSPIFNAFSKDISNLEEKLEMMKKSIMISGLLGIPWVVVHLHTDYLNNRPSINMKRNIEFYKPLLELAEMYHTGIVIENLFDTYHYPLGVSGSSEKSDRRANNYLIAQRRFGTNPEELLELVDELSAEFNNVGICWDFGHANEAGLNQVECLKLLGKRIKAVHVNDNTAVFDDHLTPFCGSVPWEEIMIQLREIGYEGCFTYENMKFFSRLPEQLMDTALSYSLKVAEYLVSLFYRTK